MENMMK